MQAKAGAPLGCGAASVQWYLVCDSCHAVPTAHELCQQVQGVIHGDGACSRAHAQRHPQTPPFGHCCYWVRCWASARLYSQSTSKQTQLASRHSFRTLSVGSVFSATAVAGVLLEADAALTVVRARARAGRTPGHPEVPERPKAACLCPCRCSRGCCIEIRSENPRGARFVG